MIREASKSPDEFPWTLFLRGDVSKHGGHPQKGFLLACPANAHATLGWELVRWGD